MLIGIREEMEVEKEGNKDEEVESRMDYVVRIEKIT